MSIGEFANIVQAHGALLNEEEQEKVISFIRTLIEERKIKTQKDIDLLTGFVGIGDSGVSDLADEHDHYIYGTPKKNVGR